MPLNDHLKLYSLIIGQILMTLSSFFLRNDGSNSFNAAMLIFLSMLFWTLGFMGIFDQMKKIWPWYSFLGLLYAIYGTFGRVLFTIEGLFAQALSLPARAGIEASERYPTIMAFVIHQSVPAFPMSILVLGVMLAIAKVVKGYTGLLVYLAGICFPLGRVLHLPWVTHFTDILLLSGMILVVISFTNGKTQGTKRYTY